MGSKLMYCIAHLVSFELMAFRACLSQNRTFGTGVSADSSRSTFLTGFCRTAPPFLPKHRFAVGPDNRFFQTEPPRTRNIYLCCSERCRVSSAYTPLMLPPTPSITGCRHDLAAGGQRQGVSQCHIVSQYRSTLII